MAPPVEHLNGGAGHAVRIRRFGSYPRPAKSSLRDYVIQLDQYKHKVYYEYLESVCQLKGALSWPLYEYSKIVHT